MGKFFAVVVFVIGAVLGIWLGLFVMFIGGIEQIVDGVQTNPADGGDIAWGIVRIMFAGFIGWCSFLICFALSALIWDASD